jgi:hypothetical protein
LGTAASDAALAMPVPAVKDGLAQSFPHAPMTGIDIPFISTSAKQAIRRLTLDGRDTTTNMKTGHPASEHR